LSQLCAGNPTDNREFRKTRGGGFRSLSSFQPIIEARALIRVYDSFVKFFCLQQFFREAVYAVPGCGLVVEQNRPSIRGSTIQTIYHEANTYDHTDMDSLLLKRVGTWGTHLKLLVGLYLSAISVPKSFRTNIFG